MMYDSDKILEKTLDYLDDEFKQFRYYASRQSYAPSVPSRNEERKMIDACVKSTLDRCMGVVMFVQSIGVEYKNVKNPYEELKQAVNQLAKTTKESIQ